MRMNLLACVERVRAFTGASNYFPSIKLRMAPRKYITANPAKTAVGFVSPWPRSARITAKPAI
jgi:hypothetical protein